LDTDEQTQSDATTLCKACGLCCTGHLFAWAKLKSTELATAETLGLKVLGTAPDQRGFNQPCPLWDGECTIYTSPHYPHFCRQYKCTLLKNVMDESIPLDNALSVVQQTKEMIGELQSMLPDSANPNFRERLVRELEHGNASAKFRQTAYRLLSVYKDQFGVKDLIEHFEEGIDSEEPHQM
jgi:hypothetical protein